MGVRYHYDTVLVQKAAEASWTRLRSFSTDPNAPALAQAVTGMRAAYPQMRAGEIVPLAQQGVTPEDPLARYVANQSAKHQKKSLGYWGTLRSGPLGPLAVGAKGLDDLGDLFLQNLRASTRTVTGLAQAAIDVPSGAFRNVVTGLPGHTGETAGGAVAGAAAGASVGLMGGIFAPVFVPVGAAVGGVIGALAGTAAPEVSGKPQNPLLQTPLGQKILRGQSVGSGYFAGAEAAAAAHETAKAAANIDGYGITPGGLLAASVSEPGTMPHRLLSGAVDASIAWKLDPMALGLKHAPVVGAQARQARRSFPAMLDARAAADEAAGLVNGARKDLMPEVAREWMTTRGAKTIARIAEIDDFETLRRSFRGVDTGTVLDLQKAKTPEAVMDILDGHLGTSILETPKIATVRTSRLAQSMPTGGVNFNSADDAVEEFDRLQRNVKLDPTKVSENNQRMAEALRRTATNPYGNKQEARRLVYDTLISPESGLLAGADPTLAKRFTANLLKKDQELLSYFQRTQVLQTTTHGVTLAGVDTALPLPGLFVDELDDTLRISRSAIRDMRRATAKYPHLMSSTSWDLFVAGGDAMMSAWRPTALLRGAWTVRVIGEEQIRMAAAGVNSLFSHPMSYFALALSDDGRVARALERFGAPGEKLAGKLGRARVGAKTAFNEAPVEAQAALRGEINEHVDVMSRKQQAAGWAQTENTDPRRSRFVREQHQATYNRYSNGTHDDGFLDAWGESLVPYHRDPVARRQANGGLLTTDAAVQGPGEEQLRRWFSEGEGNEIRQYLVAEPGGEALRSAPGVDRYLAKTHAAMHRSAGAIEDTAQLANPKVLAAVATGELDGVPMLLPDGTYNRAFSEALRPYAEAGHAPASVTGMAAVRKTAKTRLDSATQWMFDHLMSLPSAKLSRSVTFRQTYWSRMEDVIVSADQETQQGILRAAQEAKLSAAQIKKLKSRAAKGFGELNLDETDLLAKRHALDFTKNLLYDTAQKGQLSDALRLVFPFAEAQKEVMTRWAKLGTEAPQVVRRAQQIVQGGEGAGFFYKDQQTGEEMFAYPGGEWLTERLFGLPIKLGGQASSLSLFGSGVMPGVGPAIQVPTGWLLAGRPEFDELRQFISPIGSAEEPTTPKGLVADVAGAFVPSWANKAIQGGLASNDDRAFSNAVMDVWAAGLSSGKWTADTEEDIKSGLQAARNRARGLFFLRALASAGGAPTAVTPEYMAKDASGRWHMADILRKDFQAMMKADPNTANREFLAKYGDNAFAYMQSKTETLTSAPTGVEAADWVRANQALVEKHPLVYGFFAPQGGDLDYQQYLRQIQSGERTTLTPDQFAAKAQNRVGQMIFYNLKDKFGPFPSQPQREFLSQARGLIRDALPGFDDHLPLPERYTTDELVASLQEAVQDPALADTDVGWAVSVYLKARDIANAKAQAMGVKGFTQAKATAPLRDWMRSFADRLVTEVPDFAMVYERVLFKEMIDDGNPADQLAAVVS